MHDDFNSITVGGCMGGAVVGGGTGWICTVPSDLSNSIKVSGCVGGAGVGVGTGWIYTDLINLTESGSLWLGGGGRGAYFLYVWCLFEAEECLANSLK